MSQVSVKITSNHVRGAENVKIVAKFTSVYGLD